MQGLTPVLSFAGSFFFTYRYSFLFAGLIVEGPILMLASGFLLHLGIITLVPAYFALLLGDLCADISWYFVGLKAARPFLARFGHFFSITPDLFERMEKTFLNHDTKIIFISKITMGFGFALATLMAAGAARVPFKKFLLLNGLGGFIWTAFLMALGYFLGGLYFTIARGFRFMFLAALVVIVILLASGFVKYMRVRFKNHL